MLHISAFMLYIHCVDMHIYQIRDNFGTHIWILFYMQKKSKEKYQKLNTIFIFCHFIDEKETHVAMLQRG